MKISSFFRQITDSFACFVGIGQVLTPLIEEKLSQYGCIGLRILMATNVKRQQTLVNFGCFLTDVRSQAWDQSIPASESAKSNNIVGRPTASIKR